jgi:hypothetical protein
MIKYNGLGKIPANSLTAGLIQGATKPKRSFFGRLWRGIVRGAIKSLPGEFAEEILKDFGVSVEDISRGIQFNGYDTDGNIILSDLENAVIENWLNTSFIPKYKALILKGNLVFSTTNLQKQVDLINEMNNELAVLKEYLNWDNPKLSVEAEKLRNEFVADLILEIEHLIYKSIEASPVDFLPFENKILSTPQMLLPIISYVKFEAVATNYLLSDTAPVDLNPIENPINEQITEPIATEKSKTSALPWWLWLIGGTAVYRLLK